MEEGRIDPQESVRLDLAPQLGEIGRMVESVEAFGAKLGLPAAALYQITLALDELVTNIVTHGIEPGESRPITVDLSYAKGALTIALSDPGRPFDPRSIPAPAPTQSLEDTRIGGLGIHLVRSVMDSVDYRYDGARNHVTLIKRFERPAK